VEMNGLDETDLGWRGLQNATMRFPTPDPLAELNYSVSPYAFCGNNPINRIDPDGRLAGDFVDQNGNNIGNDGNKDDNVFIVRDKQEVKGIKETNKKGGTTQASDVSSAVATTKTELKESLNVLDRTEKNGGFKEESSVITPNGEVTKGATGSAEQKTMSDGTVVASAELPTVAGNDNTSIHSHLTGVKVNIDGNIESSNANIKGPEDPSTFKGYNRNIIVGPLDNAWGQKQLDGSTQVIKSSTGAVIYNRNATRQIVISKSAMIKMIK